MVWQACGERISHYHGHHCHHISPVGRGGCPRCQQHFCYQCLRKHGTPGAKVWHQVRGVSACFPSPCSIIPLPCIPSRADVAPWPCDLIWQACAHRQTFCDDAAIAANIAHPNGWPIDRRCGCQICPDCRPGGRPCDPRLCSGNCVVCRGLVPPGGFIDDDVGGGAVDVSDGDEAGAVRAAIGSLGNGLMGLLVGAHAALTPRR